MNDLPPPVPALRPGERRILLGRIVGAHGIRGDVLIRTYCETPNGIGAYGALTDESGGLRYEIKVVRETAKGVIARVKGVGDRTAAEGMRGTALYVPRSTLPAPEAGEFYYEDLAGLAVRDPAGARIGTVVGVANFGAGDLVEVRIDGAKRTELVPFADPFVGEIDVGAGWMVVDMVRVTDGERVDQPAEDDQTVEGDDGDAGAEGDAGDDEAAAETAGALGDATAPAPDASRGKRRRRR